MKIEIIDNVIRSEKTIHLKEASEGIYVLNTVLDRYIVVKDSRGKCNCIDKDNNLIYLDDHDYYVTRVTKVVSN